MREQRLSLDLSGAIPIFLSWGHYHLTPYCAFNYLSTFDIFGLFLSLTSLETVLLGKGSSAGVLLI